MKQIPKIFTCTAVVSCLLGSVDARGQSPAPFVAPAEPEYEASPPPANGERGPTQSGSSSGEQQQRSSSRDKPVALVGIGLSIGVSDSFDMNALNTKLSRAGYDELPKVRPDFAISVPISFERYMVLIRVGMRRATEDTSRFLMHSGTVSFGYSLTDPADVAVYPFVGVGLARTVLSIGPTEPADSFDDVTARPGGPAELLAFSLLGTVGLGVQVFVARFNRNTDRGIFVGGQTGLTVGLAETQWRHGSEDKPLTGGPRPPVSGFGGELTVGLRL